jgi:uncharacterized protein
MRRLSVYLFFIFTLVAGLVFGAGELLSRPAVSVIGPPPADLRAIEVSLAVSPHDRVYGWFAKGAGRGSVLLLHGVRGDRRQMLDRARFLHADGYSVLLIDLQAHGQSPGDRITFGAREAGGVGAALRYLRGQLPDQPIAVVGVSLGAASFVLSRPTIKVDAVVLESMYPTIDEAVANRLNMRLGSVGNLIVPLLLWQVPLRTGIAVGDLRPIDAITALRAPLLLAAGKEDRHTTWAETERIYAAANPPKELWAVDGAAHIDLYSFASNDYKTRILAFFAKHLRDGT